MKTIYFWMNYSIVSMVLIFSINAKVMAASYYDSNSNTIILTGGTNTLNSIDNEINNNSVLNYDPDTNTYLLNARIESNAKADLIVEDTTLLMNNTVDDEYYIQVGWNLTIDSAIIKANNGKRFYIKTPTMPGNGYSALINNSTLDGGWIIFVPPDMVSLPGSPYIRVTNFAVKNVDLRGAVTGVYPNQYSGSALTFEKTTGLNMHVDGVTISEGMKKGKVSIVK